MKQRTSFHGWVLVALACCVSIYHAMAYSLLFSSVQPTRNPERSPVPIFDDLNSESWQASTQRPMASRYIYCPPTTSFDVGCEELVGAKQPVIEAGEQKIYETYVPIRHAAIPHPYNKMYINLIDALRYDWLVPTEYAGCARNDSDCDEPLQQFDPGTWYGNYNRFSFVAKSLYRSETRENTRAIRLYARPPTMTQTKIHSIFNGGAVSIPTVFQLGDIVRDTSEIFLETLVEGGRNIVAFGDAQILNSFGSYLQAYIIGDDNNLVNMDGVDNTVSQNIFSALSGVQRSANPCIRGSRHRPRQAGQHQRNLMIPNFDVVFTHYAGSDSMGHLTSGLEQRIGDRFEVYDELLSNVIYYISNGRVGSKSYSKSASSDDVCSGVVPPISDESFNQARKDKRFSRMLPNVQEFPENKLSGMLFLTFGDHGFHNDGYHGGDTDNEIYAALYAWSNTPLYNHRLTCRLLATDVDDCVKNPIKAKYGQLDVRRDESHTMEALSSTFSYGLGTKLANLAVFLPIINLFPLYDSHYYKPSKNGPILRSEEPEMDGHRNVTYINSCEGNAGWVDVYKSVNIPVLNDLECKLTVSSEYTSIGVHKGIVTSSMKLSKVAELRHLRYLVGMLYDQVHMGADPKNIYPGAKFPGPAQESLRLSVQTLNRSKNSLDHPSWNALFLMIESIERSPLGHTYVGPNNPDLADFTFYLEKAGAYEELLVSVYRNVAESFSRYAEIVVSASEMRARRDSFLTAFVPAFIVACAILLIVVTQRNLEIPMTVAVGSLAASISGLVYHQGPATISAISGIATALILLLYSRKILSNLPRVKFHTPIKFMLDHWFWGLLLAKVIQSFFVHMDTFLATNSYRMLFTLGLTGIFLRAVYHAGALSNLFVRQHLVASTLCFLTLFRLTTLSDRYMMPSGKVAIQSVPSFISTPLCSVVVVLITAGVVLYFFILEKRRAAVEFPTGSSKKLMITGIFAGLVLILRLIRIYVESIDAIEIQYMNSIYGSALLLPLKVITGMAVHIAPESYSNYLETLVIRVAVLGCLTIVALHIRPFNHRLIALGFVLFQCILIVKQSLLVTPGTVAALAWFFYVLPYISRFGLANLDHVELTTSKYRTDPFVRPMEQAFLAYACFNTLFLASGQRNTISGIQYQIACRGFPDFVATLGIPWFILYSLVAEMCYACVALDSVPNPSWFICFEILFSAILPFLSLYFSLSNSAKILRHLTERIIRAVHVPIILSVVGANYHLVEAR